MYLGKCAEQGYRSAMCACIALSWCVSQRYGSQGRKTKSKARHGCHSGIFRSSSSTYMLLHTYLHKAAKVPLGSCFFSLNRTYMLSLLSTHIRLPCFEDLLKLLHTLFPEGEVEVEPTSKRSKSKKSARVENPIFVFFFFIRPSALTGPEED